MASENETIADISEDLRYWADRLPEDESGAWFERPVEQMQEILRDIADKIDAAWKRERAEIEQSALSCGALVERSRLKPVGNAAAMRESESVFPRGDYEAMRAALMRVESEMVRLINTEGSRVPFQPRAILDDVEHVLKNLGGAKC